MDLARALETTSRFARIHHMLSCDSTQTRSIADRGGDSAVFWADHQTAGRGRHGRSWHDQPADDVTATFRLAGLDLPSPTRLAAAMPVAVVRAIADIVPEVTIKWPNDLLLGGRKLCGILIDAEGRPPDTFHVGIGLNVNRAGFPADLMDQSTSLAIATGQQFDRAGILLRLGQAVSAVVDRLIADDVEDLIVEFKDRLGLVGHRVRAGTTEHEVHGTLTDLDLQTVVLDGTRRIALAHLQVLARG